MRPSRFRAGAPTRLALLLAAGFLLAAGAARADLWYVHYENAERALARQQWREAVEQLNQALERKADSGARVRSYGMKVVDYFPYLKLGIAYHHLGQSKAALEAFETEERLGVVQKSPEAFADLGRYRQLARAVEAKPEAPAAPDRSAEIVRSSLAEARRLEGEGRLDEAMKALAPALALSPQPREAADLMARWSARAVAEEQRRREAVALRANLEEAKGLLSRGDAPGAASLLRQVLAVAPNEEARRLLESAQTAIVASVAARERSGRIGAALDEAKRLQAAGQLAEGLERLETVLALDPANAPARDLRAQLLTASATGARTELAREELRTANAHLRAGRVEEALSAANRVLALERGNIEALGVVRQAYARISRRLLAEGGTASGNTVNLPPALRFADRRQEVDGQRVELAASPDFRLTGVAIDSSPVTIAFLDAANRPIAGESRSQTAGVYYVTEFSLNRRLGPGETRVTVVATDGAGSTSRGEYAVRYRRPWYLSPWLLAGAAATGFTGLGAGSAALLRRQRRRRRVQKEKRERRFNPYVAGGPIFDEALFFGREPLVQRVLQTVPNNSLLLHGERRIGKTSLLHQVQRRLENLDDPVYEFHPVYIDLQGTPEARLFATLADPIHEHLRPLVSGEDRIPAQERAASPAGYSHHDLVRELHGWLKILRERSAKQVKLVLLIDEVDELNDYDPRVSQSLRSLFMKRFAEQLAAVVAGVRIRKEWEKEGSPWYNFFEEIAVDSIAPGEGVRLVLEPVRGLFRFAPGAAERIVALAGGKPFQIQRRCLALVQRLHEEGRRTVTLADVETTQPEGSAAGVAT